MRTHGGPRAGSGRKRILTDEQIAAIERRMAARETVKDIAASLGVSPGTIYRRTLLKGYSRK